MQRTPTTVLVTGLLAAALVATACTSDPAEPAIADQDAARDAIVDTLTSSWTWEARMDVELTDAHVDALVDAEADGAGVGVNPAVLEKNLRLGLDEVSRQRVHGALAEDRSFLGAWTRDDGDLFQVRVDGVEVYKADTLTPEASILFTFDVPRILVFLDDLDVQLIDVEMEEIRDSIRRDEFLGEDVRTLLLTLLDGRPGGLAGELDLRWFGVTEETLGEVRETFRQQLVGVGGAELAARLLTDAITIHDLVPAEDGTTTASVDVHPREAAAAAFDVLADAQDIVEDELGWLADPDLPEAFTDVARLTFDSDGHLVEVRSDVLALARQVAPLLGDVDEPLLDALDRLAGARVDVVLALGDVGEVETAMVEPAATVPWAELRDLFFGEMIEDAGN